jgi:hypothetical protein
MPVIEKKNHKGFVHGMDINLSQKKKGKTQYVKYVK